MAKLQTKILKYLKKLPDCWAVKIIAANERGCPDILGCFKGNFFAIEVKETGCITAIQRTQFLKISKADGAYLVAGNLEMVECWFEQDLIT